MTERVRVAIVTYNNEADIVECIETLSQQIGVDAEIIVIDNGSSDKTVESVHDTFPGVRILTGQKNEGYAGGLNKVIDVSMPDFFVAVNADTSSTPDWICEAVRQVSANNHSGICQPKILLYDQKTTLNSRGNDANFLFFGWPDGYGDNDCQDQGSRPIPFASGCALVCTKECILALKGFDDSYFMYGEDVDLGLRAFIAGWDTIYSANGVVYHKYRFKESPSKYFLLERNRLTTLLKIYRLRTLLAILPAFALTELGVILKAWREGWLNEKIRSYAHVLGRVSETLDKRTEVQRLRVRGDSDLIRRLKGGLQFPSIHKSRSTLLGNRFLDKYHEFLVTLRL